MTDDTRTPTPEPPETPDDPDTVDDAEETLSHEATLRYQEMIRSARREWTQQEERGDASVQLSARVKDLIKASVRAEVRHGRQVEMPPTAEGPYSLSELALRTLIRETVDAVPGVRALRSRVDHAEPRGERLSRGRPVRIACRITASRRCHDLRALAETVRGAVLEACERELDLPLPAVDIHIEDLHDDDTA